MMPHFRKMGNLPLSVDQQTVLELLSGARPISFQPTMSRGCLRDCETTWRSSLAVNYENTVTSPRCRAGGWESGYSRVRSLTWRDRTGIRSQSNPAGIRPSRRSYILYGTLTAINLWQAFESSPVDPDQDVLVEVYSDNVLAVGVLKVHIEGVFRGHLVP